LRYDNDGQRAAGYSTWVGDGKTLRRYKPKCSGVCTRCSKTKCSTLYYVYIQKLDKLWQQGKYVTQHLSVKEYDRISEKVQL